MNREYHRWYSPSLGRDMEMLIFGHAGARLLVFPTSKGKFYEWEDRGMMEAMGEAIENGWLQVFCVDSVDEESWYARWKWPGDRAWRQTQYDNYLRNEVYPLTQKNP
ncbi:MAG TPA: esterase, partial [Anaerolineae bacterium]|nr:esterase [Anaerolineae bacterium]